MAMSKDSDDNRELDQGGQVSKRGTVQPQPWRRPQIHAQLSSRDDGHAGGIEGGHGAARLRTRGGDKGLWSMRRRTGDLRSKHGNEPQPKTQAKLPAERTCLELQCGGRCRQTLPAVRLPPSQSLNQVHTGGGLGGGMWSLLTGIHNT